MNDVTARSRGMLAGKVTESRALPLDFGLGKLLKRSAPPRAGNAAMSVSDHRIAVTHCNNDAILATVSHELRSPLAAIQNAVQLLNIQGLDTSVRQRAQALIERQLRRMTQLVDDLLDVSRINYGHLHLRRERVDLRNVVSNAIETLQSDIDERKHHLTIEFPDGPVWLFGDPLRLEQVFVNLLANASKYTDAGGELVLSVETRNGQAVARIRDFGIGIDAQALPHIFDLFRRADSASAYCQSGLGVGLALVRNLLELHGGSVTAASAGIGQGSEFTVRIPTAGGSRCHQ